ncbi:thioredoxin-like domain-containing protein [Labilibaculum sp. K2S]|uniref:TlpA family protein disulfide reductase n=1 Tax=Labilibaculum sp. K2S TaxID=3056386 RepID=UPI0025A37B8A|nr:thioredoxin-like domain-containing protein [Labilibaculum sp. K2S]MDM8162172.1 thioredoxin-like domain-containing protein [Labilibaculum sp. K2S]
MKQVFKLVLIVAVITLSHTTFAEGRKVTISLRGVYNATVAVSPFAGMRIGAPVVQDVLLANKGTMQVDVPMTLIPGEFQFKFNYRKQASDRPTPVEINLFLNHEDIHIHINPLYATGDSLTIDNDVENKVFGRFMAEVGQRRQQIGLLQQLLMGYTDRKAAVVKEAEAEMKKLSGNYNKWVKQLEEQNKALYVSRLFRFQYLTDLGQDGSGNTDALTAMAKKYLSVIDFNDTLVLRSRQLNEFVGGYMGLFGQLATTEALRDSLFTQAGRIACGLAAKGAPKMYGWMVDYFYAGYESYAIDPGMKMLELHLNNPDCLTSKRQAIEKRLEGLKKMVIGAEAPAFEAQMADSLLFRFDGVPKEKNYGLLVFYDTTCGHCSQLMQELRNWYAKLENAVWFNIVSVALNENRQVWKSAHRLEQFAWNDVWAPGGVNSEAAGKYFVLGTPMLYIVDPDLKIVAMPKDMAEVEKFLNQD